MVRRLTRWVGRFLACAAGDPSGVGAREHISGTEEFLWAPEWFGLLRGTAPAGWGGHGRL